MRLGWRPVKGRDRKAAHELRVSFDRLRMRHVLVNLVDTPSHSGAVVLRLVVPTSQRSRIIRHLTQADSTSTWSHGGTARSCRLPVSR